VGFSRFAVTVCTPSHWFDRRADRYWISDRLPGLFDKIQIAFMIDDHD
jgi:hypothetical protein